MSDLKCNNCRAVHESGKVDTTNTKEVFQGTDMSWGYWDVYSTFGLCNRCNQHSVLLKVEKRQSKLKDRLNELLNDKNAINAINGLNPSALNALTNRLDELNE